jgi:hypothetical protein
MVSRNRLKIVEFLQISGRGRLFFPVLVLEFFAQEAAALAGVPRDVLLLAEIRSNIRPVQGKTYDHGTIAEAGQRDAEQYWYSEYESHKARWS